MNRMLPTLFSELPELFDTFFFNWPDSPKPPMDQFPILDRENGEFKDGGQVIREQDIKGWEIQMAVAGYSDKDVKVWYSDQVLHIEGDNTEKGLSDKFTSKFHHQLAVAKTLDLSKAAISLKHGILSIKIPISKKDTSGTHLFGCK